MPRQSHNLFLDACNPFFTAFQYHRKHELGQIKELPVETLNASKERFHEMMTENKKQILSVSENITPEHFDTILNISKRHDWTKPEHIRIIYGTLRKFGMWKNDEVTCPKCYSKKPASTRLTTTSAAFDDSMNQVHAAIMSHRLKNDGFPGNISEELEVSRLKFMKLMREHGKNPNLKKTEGIRPAQFETLLKMAKGKDWSNPKNVMRVYEKACEIRRITPQKFNL